MRTYPLHKLAAVLSASTALLGLTDAANAADIRFTGGSGGSWNVTANWAGSSVPTTNDTAIIGSGITNIPVDTNSTVQVGSILLEDGANLSNPNGIGGSGTPGQIQIYGVNGIGVHYASAFSSTGPRNVQIMNDLEYLIDNPNGGELKTGVGFGIELGTNALTVNVVNSGNMMNIGGPVKGQGNLILIGAGTLTTSGNHAFTGYTDIRSGTFKLTGTGSLKTSSLINVDGLFDISGLGTTTTSTSIRTLTGTGEVRLGAKTLDITDASTTYAGDISGTGGVTISSGVLTLAGATSYSGATSIAAGARLQLGAGGATGSLASQQISNKGELAFNRNNAFDFSADISGNGAVFQSGTGTTTLSGNNTYSGDTNIEAGTLKAGAANAFSTSSAFTVSSGATLDLNDMDQTLVTLANAGNVNFGTSTSNNLHITGDYVGNNGMLTINAVLGDDTSNTNTIVIDGNTSGTSFLHVNNRGGTGDSTTLGIEVIKVNGSSDGDFILDAQYRAGGRPAVVIGAYEYGLYKGNAEGQNTNDWYLISKKTPVIPTPDPDTNPENPNTENPVPEKPEPQPEGKLQAGAPVYEAYSQHLLGMNNVSSLRQRTGNRVWVGQTTSSDKETATSMGNGVWGRIEGAHNRLEADYTTTGTQNRQNIFKMQAGIDGAFLENEQGRLIGGIFGQYMHGKTRTSSSDFVSGDISTDGYGLGGTLTWYGENGFYADGLAQATWYDSDLTTSAEGASALATGSHAFGYALSLESGQKLAIDNDWSVTPQGQLVYSSVDADNFIDGFGSAARFDRGESLQGRLGLNLDYASSWQNARGTTDRASLYGIANLYYEFRDGTRADLAGVSLASRQDRLWGGLGVGGSYDFDNRRYSVFGEGLVNTSLNNFGDSYTLKGNVGLRVNW